MATPMAGGQPLPSFTQLGLSCWRTKQVDWYFGLNKPYRIKADAVDAKALKAFAQKECDFVKVRSGGPKPQFRQRGK